MGEWSSECHTCEWHDGVDGPVVGATFDGHNRNGEHEWTTQGTVTVAEPGREFVFEAAQVLAAIELGRRSVVRSEDGRPQMSSPKTVAAYLLPQFGSGSVEQFGVLLLDTKHRVLRASVLSVGTLDASVVHPREVFREATAAGAAAIVLFHNHPSGDPEPSDDDVKLTDRMAAAGVLMGIGVLDHVILGDASYYSFREQRRC
jgi:DNA repair protein RadC